MTGPISSEPIEPIDRITEDVRSVRSVIRDSSDMIWALAGQGIMSATRFATAVLIGRLGSEQELGLYSIGFGVLVLVIGIHEAFVTTPLTVFLPRKSDEQQAAYRGFALRSTWQLAALLSTLLLFVAIVSRSIQQLEQLPWVLVGVAAALPLVLIREFARRLQFVYARMKLACFLDATTAVVQLGGLVLWLTQARLTAITGLLMTGVACGVASILWWRLETAGFVHDRESRTRDVRDHARFGSWMFGENLVSTIHTYLGHWFLTLGGMGAASAGIFSACLNVILIVNPFLLSITSIMAPRLAQAYSDHRRESVAVMTWRYVGLVVAILVPFAGLAAVFGGDVAELLFGKEFSGRSVEIGWLGAMTVFQGINYTTSVGLRVLNFASWTLVSALIGFVVTALLATLFLSNDVLGVVLSYTYGVVTISILRMGLLARLTIAAE